jgi:hypothetical protein
MKVFVSDDDLEDVEIMAEAISEIARLPKILESRQSHQCCT